MLLQRVRVVREPRLQLACRGRTTIARAASGDQHAERGTQALGAARAAGASRSAAERATASIGERRADGVGDRDARSSCQPKSTRAASAVIAADHRARRRARRRGRGSRRAGSRRRGRCSGARGEARERPLEQHARPAARSASPRARSSSAIETLRRRSCGQAELRRAARRRTSVKAAKLATRPAMIAYGRRRPPVAPPAKHDRQHREHARRDAR